MTLFVLLFMKITTYAYIFSIPSYGRIRIRILFRIRIYQKVLDSDSDPQHWGQDSKVSGRQDGNVANVQDGKMASGRDCKVAGGRWKVSLVLSGV
jgi:hypothetical protein